jgi:hypothetical protein
MEASLKLLRAFMEEILSKGCSAVRVTQITTI